MIVNLETAAAIAGVKPGTIRLWVFRGHIKRYGDDYETSEILHWIDHVRQNQKIRVQDAPCV